MHNPEPSFTLGALVREMALAWQRLSMYQDGHPARRQVVDRVMTVLAGLVAPTGSVAIGVTREALIGPDEKIATGMAKRLAEALYDRSVAILRFDEGVDAREVEVFLATLPRTRAREDETALWDLLAERGVTHVRMEPIDFSEVVAGDGPGAGETGGRDAPDMWEEILRRLLGDERFGGHELGAPGEGEIGLAEIRELLDRVLRRHGIDPAELSSRGSQEASGKKGDVVTALSSLLGETVGRQMKASGARESHFAAARHVAELLGAVPEGMRDGVLDAALAGMVQDEDLEEDSMEALSGSLSAAEIVSSLRRLRQERVPFSSRVLGLLDDLVLQAAPRLAEGREGAPGADRVFEGMKTLFRDDDIDRVVPAQRRMDRLAVELRRVPVHRASAEEMDPRLRTLDEHRQLLQLAQTLLDLIQRPIFDEGMLLAIADRTEEVVQALLASGRVTNAVRLVRGLEVLSGDARRSAEVRAAASRCLDRMRSAETIAALVESLGRTGESAVDVVRELIEILGPDVVRELLLALCEETDLARRRHTFDLLAALGSDVTPYALDLLGDERWYVRRNMLSLLRRIGDPIPLERIRSSLEHPDERVRLEAVKCLGTIAGGAPAAVLERLLSDVDPKVAETTAVVIGSFRIPSGREPLLDLLRGADPLARRTALRVRALQALGQIGDPSVLEELGHFFRGWFAVVSPDERRAAFGSLRGYPREARDDYARKGLKAPDAEVRAICQKLLEDAG